MGAHNETVKDNTQERRSFLGIISGLIASGITIALGSIIGRYAIKPSFRTLNQAGQAEWTELGSMDEIQEGRPVRRRISVPQNAGWGNFNNERLVWVIRKGEALTVFSAVCPHLGCTVNAGSEGFVCACHSSKWDAQGQKVSGPTPR